MTVFNWGESPIGKWKLIVEPRPRHDKIKANEGKLDQFDLRFFGYKSQSRINKRSARKSRAFIPSSEIIEKIYNSELRLSRQTRIIHKRVLDSNPSIRDILKSI